MEVRPRGKAVGTRGGHVGAKGLRALCVRVFVRPPSLCADGYVRETLRAVRDLWSRAISARHYVSERSSS